MMGNMVSIISLLWKIPVQAWLCVVLAAVIFAGGISVGHGCGRPPVALETIITRYDTLPPPPAVHDTFHVDRIRWVRDTVWERDTVTGYLSSETIPCQQMDTTTPRGTHVEIKQCFNPIVPDSVLTAMIRPLVLDIREPAPIREVVEITKTELVAKKTNWKFEAIKAVFFASAGMYIHGKYGKPSR